MRPNPYFLSFFLLTLSFFAQAEITYRDCPEGVDPCAGHTEIGTVGECIDGCAFVNEKKDFSWARILIETDRRRANSADFLAQTNCLDATAVQSAINEGLAKSPNTTASKLPCSVTGNTWRYTYAQFNVADLTPEQCRYVEASLKALATRCQDWKSSALTGGAIAGIVVGSVVFTGLIGYGFYYCFCHKNTPGENMPFAVTPGSTP